MRFARYGGLSSVNQRGYDASMPCFHSPPAQRGFYAFSWPFYELFLLGSECTSDPKTPGSKFSYVKDKDGNVITDKHPEYEKLSGRFNSWSSTTKEWDEHNKLYPEDSTSEERDAWRKAWDDKNIPTYKLTQKPKVKIFEYDGKIWHHLGGHLKPGQIIATKGSWVKSEMIDYRHALSRDIHKAGQYAMELWKQAPNLVPPIVGSKRAVNFTSKDHLEVFIEKL